MKIHANNIRHALLAAAMFFAPAAFATNTWYVAKEDPAAANTLDEGRGSEALPFRTIQAALDNPAFEAGDIVLVKRGDYDEGEYFVNGSYNMTNRVYISKTVHLKAVDGRDVTRIVGKWGKNGASDSSPDGIRCIYVAAAAAGTEIEGFTLVNGYAYGSGAGGYNGSSYTRDRNFGGGIYVANKLKTVYVIDCAFRNCLACMGPAISGGTLIRCVIYGCRSVLGSAGYATGPHMLYSAYAFGCVVMKSPAGKVTTYMLDGTSVAVNCTFHDNSCASMAMSGAGMAYNCIFAANTAQSEYPEDKLVNSYVFTASTNMAFATGFYDYRLPTDSPAIGTGSTAHRQVLIDLGVPAKYLEKDLNGATIDWSAESFNPGASQGVAVPTTTLIKFKGNTRVNGRLVYTDCWIRSETFPEIFEFNPADTTKTFYGFYRSAEGSSVKNIRPYWVYPETNGITRVILPRRVSMAYQEYTPVYAGAEMWVDPTSAGSDEDGDGSEEYPYHTLQYAVDQVNTKYTIIHAKPGNYNEGGKAQNGLMSRVNLSGIGSNNTILRSVGGPLVTTIWGAADPETAGNETEPGCGTNAVRCVCGATTSAIQGFTLRDGHTFASTSTEASKYARDGAAVGVSADDWWYPPNTVLDCIITNCVSASSICRTTYLCRSLVVGNTAKYALFNFGFFAADLIVGNKSPKIFGCDEGSEGRAWMVTAVGNTTLSCESSIDDWAGSRQNVYGSIFVDGNIPATAGADVGNVVWNHASVSKLSAKSVSANPFLADAAAGDYRPAIGGPAVDFVAATNMSLFCFYLASDYYGNPIRISSDGKLTAGAVQGSALPYKVSVAESSNGLSLLVDGVSGPVARTAEPGTVTTLTLEADTAATRYAKGYTLNGEDHLFDTYPGSAVVQAVNEPINITPIVSTEWHVDAENGNDATGNGFTAGTAKRTLAEVFTNCAVTAGDTVYAHPGTYSDGEMRTSTTAPHASRVIVPANVTLKATGSSEKTIILGAASDSEFANKYGMGTNAVRCVALGANAVLEGFTLTGGRTLPTSSISGDTAYRDFNTAGGGVAGVDRNTTALVKNCVISNNFGMFGGGGAYCRYQKCKVLSNTATSSGGGIYRSGIVRDCFVDKNEGTYIVQYSDSIYNCTIGYNNKGYGTYFWQPAAEAYKVFNSVVYRPGNNQSIYWNCVLGKDWTSVSAEKLLHGTISTNVAAIKLDSTTLRPARDSLVVDRGDDEKRGSLFPETDIDGVPRVLNGGRFDIGAFEYDWRKTYSEDLGGRVDVFEVTSNVVDVAKTVRVPEGSLSLDWKLGGSVPTFNAEVEGEGTLEILVGGESFATLTAADGCKTLALPAQTATVRLDFNYSGDGYAALSGFSRNMGTLLIVR